MAIESVYKKVNKDPLTHTYVDPVSRIYRPSTPCIPEVTETAFLIRGLDLSEQQQALPATVKAKPRLTKHKQAELAEKRVVLQRRIQKWLPTQSMFMPATISFRAAARSTPAAHTPNDTDNPILDADTVLDWDEEEGNDSSAGTSEVTVIDVDAKKFQLLLPSSPAAITNKLAPASLIEKEWRLRVALLEGYLAELRRLLRIKASAYSDKKHNAVGQRAGTRANTILANYTAKITNVANSYRESRAALLRIGPLGAWTHRLLELKKVHVRAAHLNESDIESDDEGNQEPEARSRKESERGISWIWKVPCANSKSSGGIAQDPSTMATKEEVGQALTVEWAKTHARAARYVEEEELVMEEMRRVVAYLTWKASWWRSSVGCGRVTASVRVRCGLTAYAEKQATMWERLNHKFASMWKVTIQDLKIGISLINDN